MVPWLTPLITFASKAGPQHDMSHLAIYLGLSLKMAHVISRRQGSGGAECTYCGTGTCMDEMDIVLIKPHRHRLISLALSYVIVDSDVELVRVSKMCCHPMMAAAGDSVLQGAR